LNKTYLITGVPPDLYKDFKTACAYFDITSKKTLIKHMQNIVDDYIRAIKGIDKPKRHTKKGGKKK